MSVHVSKILYDNTSSKFHCYRNISLSYPLNNYLLLWLSTYISYDDDGRDFVVLSRHIARFKVYRIILRHQFQVQSSGISQNSCHSSVDFAKHKKSVAFILHIMFFFSICFIPYVVCNAIIFTERTNWRLTIIARNSSAVLIFLSSSLNPGLFLWRMREIRTSLKQLFSN